MDNEIIQVLGIVGFESKGEYDSNKYYEKNDIVLYDGNSYCATQSSNGISPLNEDYWQLFAEKGEKGDTGDTPVKGVDYYTEQDINELETTLSSDVTAEVTSQLSSLTSATPIVAETAEDMTDTTRIYVLETDGHWYWYDGEEWQDGGVYQADINTDEMNKLDKFTVDLDNRNKSDYSPTILNLVDKVYKYNTGEVIATGDGTGWTDEYYYNVEDVTGVEVKTGYQVYAMFYALDKTFAFGTAKNADFNLSAYNYKYVRFCIRKTNPLHTLTKLEAQNNVIVSTNNRYYRDKQMLDISNKYFNDLVYSGTTEYIPTWKIGRLKTDGTIVNTLVYRYLEEYFETETIDYVHIPADFRLQIIYYDESKTYVHNSTSDGVGDYIPLKQYKYCRFTFCKISGSQFQDDLNIYKSFQIVLNASKILTNKMIYAKDICPKLASDYSATSNGVTYTFDGEKLHVEGTANAYSYIQIYSNSTKLPEGFEVGKKYRLDFTGLPARLNVRIQKATSTGWSNSDVFEEYYYGGEFTIPYDAVGLRIWISVNSGYTVDGDYTPHIYAVDSLEYAANFKTKKPKPMLTIIYDDGNKKFKDYILPIIQNKNVPISTAVVVSEIESQNPYSMDYDDIKECYRVGAEVLVHTEARSEVEWGNNMYAVAYELRHAKYTLNNEGFNVPNCYVFSGGSAGYPVCIEAAKNVFDCGMDPGYTQSVARNEGITNYYGNIDNFKIRRRWADTNWTEPEANPENVLKSWIDELAENGTGWQVWTRHNNYGDEETNAQLLSTLIDYAISMGVEIVTVEKGMREYLDL